jgi:hypothetical protein
MTRVLLTAPAAEVPANEGVRASRAPVTKGQIALLAVVAREASQREARGEPAQLALLALVGLALEREEAA